MPNGSVRDHPLTDIVFHKRNVYGQEADDLIRKISELSSRRELEDWWNQEVGWSGDAAVVLTRAPIRLGELIRRAKEGGWEIRSEG